MIVLQKSLALRADFAQLLGIFDLFQSRFIALQMSKQAFEVGGAKADVF